MRNLALALAFLAASTALAQTEATAVLKLSGMENVEVRKDIRYDGERTFDLYRPAGARDALPLVLFINGVGRPDLKEKALALLDKLPEGRRQAIRESAEAKLRRLKK